MRKQSFCKQNSISSQAHNWNAFIETRPESDYFYGKDHTKGRLRFNDFMH